MRWMLIACLGCTSPAGSLPSTLDAEVVDARTDAPLDQPVDMAERQDVVLTDAEAVDAAPFDAGSLDAGSFDARLADAESRDAGPAECARYSAATVVARLPGVAFAEISGIAASRQSPDVLWVHNDSGNAPAVFAIDTTGQIRARVPLPESAADLEDIAIARCPTAERQCLFVADIGDNRAARDAVQIFVVPEPPVPAAWDEEDTIVDGIITLRRTWPDGPQDAEALVVAPDGDRLWIISKVEEGPSAVVGSDTRTPQAELRRVTAFAAPGIAVPMGQMITGADLHPDGERLAVRVYTGSYEYRLPGGDLAALSDAVPRRISLGPLSEPQGEAIAYAAGGDAIWTASEDPTGEQPLHRYVCE